MQTSTLRILPVFLVAGLFACGPTQSRDGTQIGFEEDLECELVSTQTVTDLSSVPPDFTVSPQAILDDYVGEFHAIELGTATLEDIPVQDSTSEATLVVSLEADSVTLEHYAPVENPYETETFECASLYAFELGFTLVVADLPTFDAPLRAVYNEQSDWLMAESTDLSAFDGELPEPTTFAPGDFERVEARLRLDGQQQGWWMVLSWEASNPSEAAPDGDLTIFRENIVVASLELP